MALGNEDVYIQLFIYLVILRVLTPALMLQCFFRWCLLLLGPSLHRGITPISRIAGVCLMDSWCFLSGCLWCCRYIHYLLVCFSIIKLLFLSDIRQVIRFPQLSPPHDSFRILSGLWNSKACGSDVSMGNAENSPGAYYDPGLQDLFPFWASSLPHHEHSKVQHCHEHFSL